MSKPRNPIPKALRLPAGGLTVEQESDEAKGLRLLAGLRAWQKSPQHVLCITLEGDAITLLRVKDLRERGAIPPEANTESQVDW